MNSNFARLLFLLVAINYSFSLSSQNKEIDSLYANFFKITKVEAKLYEGTYVVSKLISVNDLKRVSYVIQELQGTSASPSQKDLKNGVICLTKAILHSALQYSDSIAFYADCAIPLLTKYPKIKTDAQGLLALSYFLKGQFDSCITVGTQGLVEVHAAENINAELMILSAMSRSYDYLGDRKHAIDICLRAIGIAKQQKKFVKLSELYASLSAVYKEENYNLAKTYGLLAINVCEKIQGNTGKIACSNAYLHLGNAYFQLQKLDSAKYYYNLCKESALSTNDTRLYVAALANIGNIAVTEKDFILGLKFNKLALTEYKKMGILADIAICYGSMADLCKDMKDYKNAVKYYDSALVITKQIQSAEDFILNYRGLSETYEMIGNDKLALTNFKLYKFWNDSINNNESSKKIHALELDFKYKSQQREKDLIQENKDLITQEKINQQKHTIWASVLGGLCLVIFLGFTIKSNIEKKKTNKQLQIFNDEISEQKNIIQEKNSEITDSITYASRIQQGVIPDEEELKELLPNNFVFFKPRDIVSGDFYWATKVKSKTNPNSKRTVVAVVDCTGHGVPGAFMSLVGNTLLNQTIGRSIISNPAQALDYVNAQLPKTIKSKLSTGTIKDGMEIAMCDINFDTLTMQFAGANSNIYIVRSGVIQIYKGDKQPIGESYSGTIMSYTNQIISLQKNDCIYLISDGYADQFGGDKGKKFKYKPLENLFCSIADKDVSEQRTVLANAFDDWKKQHEQVDDVLIMGIKI